MNIDNPYVVDDPELQREICDALARESIKATGGRGGSRVEAEQLVKRYLGYPDVDELVVSDAGAEVDRLTSEHGYLQSLGGRS